MKSKRWVAIMAFLFISSSVLYAQDDIPDYDPNIPVDGGIGLLVAAGAFFGIRKLKGKK